MTRNEHVTWCKERALALVDDGDLEQAFTSMFSDLGKHPETQGHTGMQLGSRLLVGGHLNTEAKMREFIKGFN